VQTLPCKLFLFWEVEFKDDNMGQPNLFMLGLHKARTLRAGLPRPAQFMRVAITSTPCTSLGPRADPHFFFIFMIKLSMFKI